jgi:Kef-type K+ transport system membrane component KefB
MSGRKFLCFPVLSALILPSGAWASEEGAAGVEVADISGVLLALIVILLAAKIGGEIFEKLKQPAVLGELVLGIIVGNLALISGGSLSFGQLFDNEVVGILAEIGVMILLFQVGLESNIKEMTKVGISSVLVATIGVIAPMVLGYYVSSWLLPEAGFNTHLFIGATLTATSVGITARVLKDFGKLSIPEAKIILGAAVVDDVLGLIILAIVSGIVKSGTISIGSVISISLTSVIFLLGAIIVGSWSAPRIGKWVSGMQVEGMKIVTAFLFMLVMAYAADVVGLATIVGAFAAGLVLDDVVFTNKEEHHIEDLVKPLYCIFVPIFFVLMGIEVDLSVFLDPQVIMIALGITAAAVLGKQVCGLGVVKCPQADRLIIGIGMISRGEVGLIFASAGKALGVISDAVFGAIVIMVILTTLITPPLLKWSIQRKDARS